MLNSLIELLLNTGFFYVDWRMMVMWIVVFVLLYLAVYRDYEPLLLVPIAFGALLANLPTIGILNKPAGPVLSTTSGDLSYVFVQRGDNITMPRTARETPKNIANLLDQKAFDTKDSQKLEKLKKDAGITIAEYFAAVGESTTADARLLTEELAKGYPNLIAIIKKNSPDHEWKNTVYEVPFQGKVLTVRPADELIFAQSGGVVTKVDFKVGDKILFGDEICTVYGSHAGGLYYYIQQGILLEIFPPLIFLGVGALTDFGPLIANPKTLLLGGAAQFGIFITFVGALLLGFNSMEAASIGIIGGADGPTSIFTTNKLAPHLLAPIAVAAYSYMSLVPVIQPPIMRLLTTQKERKIRMKTLRKVTKLEKLIFALIVTILCILLVPDASALIGMLMLGNFLRECGVTERLNKAAQNEIINIVTIFLGTSVGITMSGDRFIRVETLSILALGVVAFAGSTAAGVIGAKLMNLVLKDKINPLIGSAGVSAVPMAARVSHVEGQKADPSNFLIMHAMGPNVAGVIGTAIVAGFFIASLGHMAGH